MTIVKKVLASLAAGALAFGMVGGINTSSFADEINTLQNGKTTTENSSSIKSEIQVIDGKTYEIQWNTEDDSIKIFGPNGDLMGSTTMSKVKMMYSVQMGEQLTPGVSLNPGATPYAPNACSITLNAVGIANGVLWAAAGVTAVTPPAAIVAGGAGVVTSAIISTGSLWC